MATTTEKMVRDLLAQYKTDVLREVEAMFVQLKEDIQDDHQRRLEDITVQFESMQTDIGLMMDQSVVNIVEQIAPQRGRRSKPGAPKSGRKPGKAEEISLEDLPY